MKSISYAESSRLRECLQKIDDLRKDILMVTLTPKQELRFRWQATIERIFWLLILSNVPITKNEIAKLLKDPLNRQSTPLQKEILACKNGFDYITQEWIGSQESVSSKIILLSHQASCSGKLRISQESLKSCLLYFQNSNEHPVIQAALIHFQVLFLSPFTEDNDRISHLLSYLFLYKNGFYCRGFLILEEYFKRNLIDYQQTFKQTTQMDTQTLWIEYFANAVESGLEKALEKIATNKITIEMPASTFKLNERQKKILTMLENPDSTITNRQTQELFGVSPITASRDLAKLASLGILFAHNKGRSVYYTKI